MSLKTRTAVGPKITVKFILPEETYELRLQVLRPGLPPEQAVFPADQWPGSFHLGAFDDGNRLKSVASFQKEGHKEFQANKPFRLRGMATHPTVQGLGFGAQIVQFSLEHLRQIDCDFLWCNAREIAFGFYEKLGFRFHGPLFDIPGVGPHKVMWIKLTLKP